MRRRVVCLLLALQTLLCLGLPACAAAGNAAPPTPTASAAAGFVDVAGDAWYAGAVEYCRDNGLMEGTTDTAFSPDAPASRAMLAAVLYRQAGSPAAVQSAEFSDVNPGSWYAPAVAWAAGRGITGGYGDGRFGPDDPVMREQLAVLLWRCEGSPSPASASPFADQSAISSFAADAAAWTQAEGILTGKAGNRFDPQGTATRAELAAVLSRWLGGERPHQQPEAQGRVLVAYFSHTGNTRAVAETVAELTGGDLFEIVPETPYPTDYGACLEQARQELSADARPALSSRVENMEQYGVICLGFPIWHGDTPMPVRSFLDAYDLSGKTIAPFSTSGSSGIGAAEASIRALCPGSTTAEGLSITSGTLSRADALAADWVKALGLDTRAALPALDIQAGGRTFRAALEDTDAARALLELLPMTVTMEELNGNEKYYYLPQNLPVDAQRPGAIQAGDLMLYGSDCLVLFYESISSQYSYTRLGRVDDPAGLAEALGAGSVEVTLRAARP